MGQLRVFPGLSLGFSSLLFFGFILVRLTKLKIAGFKSFVEPTMIVFPGQIAGVVGPNGCGKSNIIDAARWVLGESKASELRGESIQDVIFKGSGNRKPVSRASVELFFDNPHGRAAGQWSQYAEITVKRILDREGNSSYYINNLHVRRRDVIDLFLGTGLGPRSYAIIGQDMISRIIESKPDELRLFLEEAAGVTKYKERRKETEHRLEDARENLARIEDIRNELEAQVAHLAVQAEVARNYRGLQTRMTHSQTLLWLKKRNDAHNDSGRLAQQVAEAVNRVEAETARLRESEARTEQAREAHFSASDTLHAAQAGMYAANGEVARLEAELAHLRDARTRLAARLTQLADEENRWLAQRDELQGEAGRWQSLLELATQRVASVALRHGEAAAQLAGIETTMQEAASQVAEARRRMSEVEQSWRLAEADRGHAERALENLRQRRTRLAEERQALDAPDPAVLASAREKERQTHAALAAAQEELARLQGAVPQAEAALRAARDALQAAHRRLTESRARHDALAQLQARVAQPGEIGAWLARHGLAEARPLWQSIQVESGWETAVEAVLRERFAALAANADVVKSALADPPPALLVLALPGASSGVPGAPGAPLAADSLRVKVRALDERWNGVLDAWLGPVRVGDDLAALAGGGTHDIVVSPAGHLLAPGGVTLYVPDSKTHGVIERQREIDQLAVQLTTLAADEQAAREAQQAAEQHLGELQTRLAMARRGQQESQQTLHAAQVEALKLGQAQARFEERSARLDQELGELARQEENETARRIRTEQEARQQQGQLAECRQQLEQALEIQRRHEASLRETRALESQLARETQEAGFSERECHSKLEDNARTAATAGTQLERIAAELAQARAEQAGISDAVLAEQLQSALAERQGKESALAERRNALESAASELRGLDEQRLTLERNIGPLRERINELRLKAQAAQLTEEQYQQRLAELQIVNQGDEAPYAEELAGSLKDNVLQAEITRLANEIETLGPVNLAALEELATTTERKGFLDAQSADLNAAIGTLEDAIRRIDRETHAQLQATYDAVNARFGTLFPELFGGGEARLMLTGEEILDAGIQIMAQPPGKKNSTIHLLSGGEKALTAIALVFAFFHLNPAPFCMLDEVDAPLDDSNTLRFCEMVKRMSAQTQFIFISHSKITMEMAEQLIGVTMQEQGVSCVVEVDIGEALRLAEAA
ncbi:MAG: chromosome segregation protein SMC [Betaproteobacteria bacterium HGW-Betaproteobacteria-11]|nr:MAG: chromosome segregation protein SMC [Betaproteobacteria bacterium HGW-Betaproteobacteria-11]